MGKNTNPMVFGGATGASTSVTGSVFFSTPTVVEEIVLKWAAASTSVSIRLVDMDLNDVIHYVPATSAGTEIITGVPKLFPNGLQVSTSSSIAIEGANVKLFIWVR